MHADVACGMSRRITPTPLVDEAPSTSFGGTSFFAPPSASQPDGARPEELQQPSVPRAPAPSRSKQPLRRLHVGPVSPQAVECLVVNWQAVGYIICRESLVRRADPEHMPCKYAYEIFVLVCSAADKGGGRGGAFGGARGQSCRRGRCPGNSCGT